MVNLHWISEIPAVFPQKKTCWSRLVMENMVWIYKLYSLIPDLQIDIPSSFQPSFLHNFISTLDLQRVFCVFLFVRSVCQAVLKGINNHNIDIDSARTLLGAAVLATAQAKINEKQMMKTSKLPNKQTTNRSENEVETPTCHHIFLVSLRFQVSSWGSWTFDTKKNHPLGWSMAPGVVTSTFELLCSCRGWSQACLGRGGSWASNYLLQLGWMWCSWNLTDLGTS